MGMGTTSTPIITSTPLKKVSITSTSITTKNTKKMVTNINALLSKKTNRLMADQRYHDLDHEHSDHHEHTGEEGVDHQHVDHHEEHKGDGHQLQRTLIEKDELPMMA